MPQMAPILWLYLLILFYLIFIMIMSFISVKMIKLTYYFKFPVKLFMWKW